MRKAIAIDFDGCLCKNAWPDIGEPNWDVIRAALEEKRRGTALILWTCRAGDLLDAALAACSEWSLTFDAANENLPERIEHYGTESRKVSADEYWDDCAVHMPEPPNPPLTLDELRRMDGEPVWIVGANDAAIERNGYAEVDFFYEDRPYIFWFGNEVEDTPKIEDYGKTWVAYRRRPKGANK